LEAKQTGSKQRPPLDKDQVLRAAIAIADQGGLQSLTMRKLSEDLDVEAMSLYYHVANKEEILDGMIDIVMGDIHLPAENAEWRSEMRKRAISAHAELTRHPWAISLIDSRTNPGPASLRHYDTVIGCLTEAGFSLPQVAHAFSAVDAYIYGFGIQEMNLPFDDEDDIAEVAENILALFPSDEYPNLATMIVDHALQPGYNYQDEFTFGLDIVLDGFERLLHTEG
jgi:AcrR family transcriptional regulator